MKILILSVALFSHMFFQGSELVKYVGTLNAIMQRNDVSAKINLNDIKNKQNLYALGAAENLKGEIQIFNGIPVNSEVENNKIIIKNSFDKGAALLVYTNVKDWKEITIKESFADLKSIEDKIDILAKQNGIDPDKPFPFLIKANVKKLYWHVVDAAAGNVSKSNSDHKNSGIKGEVMDEPVEIIGFYSKIVMVFLLIILRIHICTSKIKMHW